MKKSILLILVSLCSLCTYGQKDLQGKSTTRASLKGTTTGVAAADVDISYIVRASAKDEIVVSVTFDRISIDAQAGYYYEGKKYGREVPGLIEALAGNYGTFPNVSFDIYYGTIKIGTKSIQISARNDLSLLTGDSFTLKVNESQIKSPNFSVRATVLKDFNYAPDVTLGMTLRSKVTSYLKDQQINAEYQKLIQTGDNDFAAKRYGEARANYYKAVVLKDDRYPKAQIELIDKEQAALQSKEQIEQIKRTARQFEDEGKLNYALGEYERAKLLGKSYDNTDINRVKNAIQRKRQEEELKLQEEEKKRHELLAAKEKDMAEKETLMIQANKQLEEERHKEEEKIYAEAEIELEKQKRTEMEAERNQLRKQEEEERLRAAEGRRQEEKRKIEKRKEQLNNDIEEAEAHMSYNPELFEQFRDDADELYEKALAINPDGELHVEDEWWTHNSFMESVKLQLEEPKRQDAWGRYHTKLEEQLSYYTQAKYTYIHAIRYTERDSKQHTWLLRQVKNVDRMVELQEKFVKTSHEQEGVRQKQVKEAIAYRIIKRQNDSRTAATILYRHKIENQMYRHHGTQDNKNALMNSFYFEQRLNQAKAVTDFKQVTTATVTNAVLEIGEGKSLADYTNNSWGIDMFLNGFGVVAMPVAGNAYNVNDETKILSSEITTTLMMSSGGGLDVWINKGNIWDLSLGGEFMLGWMPFAGYSDFYYNPTGILKANVGIKAVKLAIEIHHGYMGGSSRQDLDVALADANANNPYAQATEHLFKSKYGYSYGRYGTGLQFTFNDGNYIRLLGYAERPSFHHQWNYKKPPMTFEFTFTSDDKKYSITYGENNPIAGNAEKMITNSSGGKYLKVQILCPIWTIFNSRSK